MSVTELAYIGISSTDTMEWSNVLHDIVGMQRVAEVRPSVDYYRMDERTCRIFVEKGKKDAVQVIGWGVNSEHELDILCNKISAAGISVSEASTELSHLRGTRALRSFTDPEGHNIELAFAPPACDIPFSPGRPISGFNTGDLGLGHIVLHCSRYEEVVEFYRDILGFKVSDYIVWADADATFLRCNPRHHSLALLNESLGMEGGAINHIMVEMKSLSDVGRAYDVVLDRQLPIIMTLGQHSNDKAVSFYFVAPGGIGIEVGWNGVTIEDEEGWQVSKYNSTKIWGHRMD